MNWTFPNLWNSASPDDQEDGTRPPCLCDNRPFHGLWVGTIGASNWVGALSAYNEGSLQGAWLDLMRIETTDDWEAAITHLRETSSDQSELRTRVLDATGLGLHLGQKPSGTDVVAIARVARHLSSDAIPAFEAWIDISGWDLCEHGAEVTMERFQAEYQGNHQSLEAWAMEQLRHSGLLGSVPAELVPFLDALGWVRSQRSGELVAAELAGSDSHVAIFLRP